VFTPFATVRKRTTGRVRTRERNAEPVNRSQTRCQVGRAHALSWRICRTVDISAPVRPCAPASGARASWQVCWQVRNGKWQVLVLKFKIATCHCYAGGEWRVARSNFNLTIYNVSCHYAVCGMQCRPLVSDRSGGRYGRGQLPDQPSSRVLRDSTAKQQMEVQRRELI
jgi:hypothetical protein